VPSRPYLVAALVEYPLLAGRLRIKAQNGELMDLEVVLNDAGVG
jgi:hypothetical protein